MRIASLTPAATEVVCLLGQRRRLVGVSHECDYPGGLEGLPRLTRPLLPTGTSSAEIDRLVRESTAEERPLYALDVETLAALRPDLILTQSLCGVCAVDSYQVEEAVAGIRGSPEVLMLSPSRLGDVLDSIGEVARAAAVAPDHATGVVEALQARVAAVAERSASVTEPLRVAVLEWLDPPFCAGHWNPELVRLAGGIEGLGTAGAPSRTLAWEELAAWDPEVVLVACCGLDVERASEDLASVRSVPGWREVTAVRAGRVYVADGSQLFNRPGPRLVDSLEVLAHALHPTVHPRPEGFSAVRQADSRQPARSG